MESDLFVGSRLRLSNIKTLGIDPRASVTHKPPKGKVFVAVLIGVEDKKPETNDDIITGEQAMEILKKLTAEEEPEHEPIIGATISSATGVMG